jgi:hypothetical protein
VAPSVDHSNVTLLSSPILTLKVLGILLGRGFKASISFILNNALLIIALISLVAAFLYAPGPHEIVRKLSILTLLVPRYSKGLRLLRILVDCVGHHVECWLWDRSAYLCAIPGATYSKSYDGRKLVQLRARESAFSMGLPPLQGLPRIYRHTYHPCPQHISSCYR